MQDWNLIVPLGLLIVGIGGFFIANTTKYITIREFESLLNALHREQNQHLEALHRELDQIRHGIQILEQTRPTTGELRAVIEGRLNGKSKEL